MKRWRERGDNVARQSLSDLSGYYQRMLMQTHANCTHIKSAFLNTHIQCTVHVGLLVCRPHLISCRVVLCKESKIREEKREGEEEVLLVCCSVPSSSFFSAPAWLLSIYLSLVSLHSCCCCRSVFLHCCFFPPALSLFSVSPSFNLALTLFLPFSLLEIFRSTFHLTCDCFVACMCAC